MGYKTDKKIFKQLGLLAYLNTAETHITEASAQGPGMLDLVRAATSDDQNIWHSFKDLQQEKRKPAVILSNPWRRYFPITEEELAIYHALIRWGFPVYVWRGAEHLDQLEPVLDADDLAEQLKASVAGDEYSIRTAIENHPKRSFGDYVVVDAKKLGVVPNAEQFNQFLTQREQRATLPAELKFFDTHYKALDLAGEDAVTSLELNEVTLEGKLTLPPNLTTLKLIDSDIRYLLSADGTLDLRGFTQLTFLEVQDFLSLNGIKKLLLPPTVQHVKIYACKNLEEINLPELKKLKSLEITNSVNVEIESFPESLTSLVLGCMTHLPFTKFKFDSSSLPPKLKTLQLKNVAQCETLDFSHLTALESVKLQCEKELKKIHLPTDLKFFLAHSCENLRDTNIETLNTLESLDISEAPELQLRTYSESLKTLRLEQVVCPATLDLQHLSHLELLQFYKLYQCTEVQLPAKSNLHDVDANLIGIDGDKKIPLTLTGLENQQQLGALKLEYISAKNLSFPQNITSITLEYNESIKILDLSAYTQLTHVNIDDFSELETLILPPQIKSLAIHRKNKIKNLNLSMQTELEILSLSSFGNPNFSGAQIIFPPKLKRLKLSNMKLDAIKGENFPNLEDLFIFSVEEKKSVLLDLSGFPQLKSAHIQSIAFKKIVLKNCPHLCAFTQRANSNINTLDFSNSPQVKWIKYKSDHEVSIIGLTPGNDVNIKNQGSSNTSASTPRIFSSRSKPSPLHTHSHCTYGFNSKTEASQAPIRAFGDYLAKIYTKVKDGALIDSAGYRFNVMGDIKESNGCPILAADLGDENFEEITFPKSASTSSTANPANVKIKHLKAGEYIPLVTLGAQQKISALTCSNPAIKIFRHKKYQHYYIRSKKPLTEVTLDYFLEEDNTPAPSINVNHSLSRQLRIKLTSELKNHPPLAFLFNARIPAKEKLLRLKDYCAAFKPQKLDITSGDTAFSTLIKGIKAQAGACGQRSFVFVLLARLANTDTLFNANGKHAFPELLEKGVWQRHDLGGEAIEYLYSEEAKRFGNTRESGDKLKAALDASGPYDDLFEDRIAENTLDDVTELVNMRAHPLVLLQSGQSGRAINAAIRQAYKEGNDILFIENEKQFEAWFEPYVIRDHQRIKEAGPLKKLVEEKSERGRILVIDWTKIKGKTGAYKSLIDKVPKLHGSDVAPGLKIINVIDNLAHANEAFVSRCRRVQVSHEALKVELPSQQSAAKKNKKTINVFSLPIWRKFILGEITADGKGGMAYAHTALKEAIENKQPLHILNPPNDLEFDLLLYQVNVEKQVVLDNQIIQVPGECVITTEIDKTLDESRVSVHTDQNELTGAERLLNLQTFYQLIEELIVKEDHCFELVPGWLSQCDSFYVTESIPTGVWQYILDTINKKYPHKNYTFHLAPGVAIGDQHNADKQVCEIVTLPPETIAQATKSIIRSNDPSAAVTAFKGKAWCIPVNATMGVSDFIEKVQRQKRGDNLLRFEHQTHALITALADGQDVVLYGEIAPSVYQALLPLLTPGEGQRTIRINGEDKVITGHLKLVTSLECAETLPLQAVNEILFDWRDYEKLWAQEKIDVPFEKIKIFYELARQMPHRGISMPDMPAITWAKLKAMTNALKDDANTHKNRIKSVWLYDYRKGSREYCYLNVLGKILFSPALTDDIPDVDIKKLSALLHKYQLLSDADAERAYVYRFELLNCLSPRTLQLLFGKNTEILMRKMDVGSYPAQINKEFWSSIFSVFMQEKCFGEDIEMPPPKKQGRVEKCKAAIDAFIDDDEKYVLAIKGAAGVGKKKQVYNALVGKAEVIIGDIEYWLSRLTETSGTKKKVLLVPKANLHKPGYFNCLRNLANKEPLYYQGKRYPFSEDAKVILIEDFDDAPGRQRHRFFQEAVPRHFTALPYDKYLLEDIVQPLLDHYFGAKDVASTVLSAFHQIAKMFPTQLTSLYELIRVTMRVNQFGMKGHSLKQALGKAIFDEFYWSLPEQADRTRLLKFLNEEFGYAASLSAENETVEVSGKYFPASWGSMIDALQDLLRLRQECIVGQWEFPIAFNGVLFEAERGIGKTTLQQLLMDEFNIEAEEITVGSDDVYEILSKNFYAGNVVILDELNLDERVEAFLSQLLSGTDAEGNPADNPGFMVFASQNPATYKNTKKLSPSFLSQFQRFYIATHNEEELASVLGENADIDDPQAFARTCMRYQQQYPDLIDTRAFFELAEQAALQASRKIIPAKAA